MHRAASPDERWNACSCAASSTDGLRLVPRSRWWSRRSSGLSAPDRLIALEEKGLHEGSRRKEGRTTQGAENGPETGPETKFDPWYASAVSITRREARANFVADALADSEGAD